MAKPLDVGTVARMLADAARLGNPLGGATVGTGYGAVHVLARWRPLIAAMRDDVMGGKNPPADVADALDIASRVGELLPLPEDVTLPGSVIDPDDAARLQRAADVLSRFGKEPDDKPDKRKKSGPLAMPSDATLQELIRALRRRVPQGETQTAIAREFAGPDAESMLRQARRYRHLWDPRVLRDD